MAMGEQFSQGGQNLGSPGNLGKPPKGGWFPPKKNGFGTQNLGVWGRDTAPIKRGGVYKGGAAQGENNPLYGGAAKDGGLIPHDTNREPCTIF